MSTRHLLQIEGLGRGDVEAILERATLHRGDAAPRAPLAGKLVANVFFENSTRTRGSFEAAAKRLGAEVLNWTAQGSSVSKGETLLDTLRNIDALGPVIVVLRHPNAGAAHLAARFVRCAVVNAGDGTHEHPSQGLLDALTLRERLGTLEGKRIALVGDILHSRVARSNIHCLKLLGAHVIACGPRTLIPVGLPELGVEVFNTLDAALENVDAVMALRIQLERQSLGMFPSAREYAQEFGLTVARVNRLPPHVPILHPGPVNRGVEVAFDVADGERSVILEQVRNGVAVRKAILELLA
ncbi:MAG: aspartate carbamoyltransferase catalytic subunit [Myxococcaceae bacterium]